MESQQVVSLVEPICGERHTGANLIATNGRPDNAAAGLIESNHQGQRIGVVVDITLKR